MIKIYPYEKLGHNDYGWLNARYHFSFGDYQNPERVNFGPLRVINDDIVQPGSGFAPHGHADMEIITYVRKGAITHKDSEGNEGRTEAGDVQVMSAGSGIRHSEYNHEPGETNLYQIWIHPREKGTKPRWDARTFPKKPANDSLNLLVSGRENDQGENVLYIDADAAIYGGRLAKGTAIRHEMNGKAYALVSEGEITLNGHAMKRGDGAEITETDTLEISAAKPAEVIVIELDES